MVVYTVVNIGSPGTNYNNHDGIVVDRGSSQYDGSSNYEINYSNPFGRYANTFNIGDPVTIYVKQGSVPVSGTDSPFTAGYLEAKNFNGPDAPTQENLKLTGRGYISILQDTMMAPVVYTSLEVGSIVKSVMATNCPLIDTTNVINTGITQSRIAFSEISAYDALKQLADLVDAYFYVDANKKLFFQITGTSSSTNLLAGTNVLNVTTTQSRQPMFNQVKVYGNKLLVDAGKQSFTANGGSVYQLTYLNPQNVSVLVGGSTVAKQGGIFNITNSGDPGSGTQYLVDVPAGRIIFASGTNSGMNIPVSGTDAIVVNYQRYRQIIKYGQDDNSVTLYKPKAYTMVDTNINDPTTAQSLVLSLLEQNAYPFKQVDLAYKGFADLQPGQTVGINEPYIEVSGAAYSVLKTHYDLSPQNLLTERVLTVTANQKIIDGADMIKQSLMELKRLRAQNTLTGQVYTRIQSAPGSANARETNWSVLTGGLGSSFILGHPTLGILGTTSPQPYLGDSRNTKSVVQSGGRWGISWPWTWSHRWFNGSVVG